MKTKKINFKELKGALSRAEMKEIMAGSSGVWCGSDPNFCNVWYNSSCYTCYLGTCYFNTSLCHQA
ncbi:MAG: hypothetical protein ACR2FN_11885 [Chitinophagaceae bacterium]